MKRIFMLLAVALMLAAAMARSGVAQAKPTTNGKAGVQCMKRAIKTLGPGFNPNNYNFIGGTAGSDNFTDTDGQSEVFCGFGGNDSIGTLDQGDIFFGGAGDDSVGYNGGTFNYGNWN